MVRTNQLCSAPQLRLVLLSEAVSLREEVPGPALVPTCPRLESPGRRSRRAPTQRGSQTRAGRNTGLLLQQ